MGVTEHQLSLGGKLGISTSHGLSAVLMGWLFIATAFGLVGVLVLRSRFRNIIWLGLGMSFIAMAVVYCFSGYAPAM